MVTAGAKIRRTMISESSCRRPVEEREAAGVTPAMVRRVRIALIGCGAISEQMHLPVLSGHEGIQLSALVDRDIARAKKLADGYQVATVLADANELSSDLIDAAIIATPPFHHAPCAIELMRRGIHVFVEQPMALNLSEAGAMLEAAESNQVVLSVGFFRRLLPSIRLMKSLVQSGWLGAPMS